LGKYIDLIGLENLNKGDFILLQNIYVDWVRKLNEEDFIGKKEKVELIGLMGGRD